MYIASFLSRNKCIFLHLWQIKIGTTDERSKKFAHCLAKVTYCVQMQNYAECSTLFFKKIYLLTSLISKLSRSFS